MNEYEGLEMKGQRHYEDIKVATYENTGKGNCYCHETCIVTCR